MLLRPSVLRTETLRACVQICFRNKVLFLLCKESKVYKIQKHNLAQLRGREGEREGERGQKVVSTSSRRRVGERRLTCCAVFNKWRIIVFYRTAAHTLPEYITQVRVLVRVPVRVQVEPNQSPFYILLSSAINSPRAHTFTSFLLTSR